MRKTSHRRYVIRAVIFQDGDWLCVQCLDYDLAAQAKSLSQLNKAFHRLIIGHVALRLRHKQRPFQGLPRAPQKYWVMFQRSKLSLPAQMFPVNGLKTRGVVVAPPVVRVAPPAAA
jgi:hypothetical protein